MRPAATRSQAAENDIAAAVTRLYVLVARATRQIASRQADVTLFERLADVAGDEFRAGTTTRLDVAQANVQLARARQALLSARNDRENARVALLNAIGANEGSTLILADKSPLTRRSPTWPRRWRAPRASRPELASSKPPSGPPSSPSLPHARSTCRASASISRRHERQPDQRPLLDASYRSHGFGASLPRRDRRTPRPRQSAARRRPDAARTARSATSNRKSAVRDHPSKMRSRA